MKNIVIWYSRKGSNKFLADKIAKELACDKEEIRPRLNVFILFLMNIHLGNKPLKREIGLYDRVILCGPIWMGKFIPPLRSFVNTYNNKIKSLVFVSCCGSPYSKKDEKFGHGLVFREVQKMLDGRCTECQAFPVGLVMPEGHQEDPDAFMKTHLNEDNFNGEIQKIFDSLMLKLKLK